MPRAPWHRGRHRRTLAGCMTRPVRSLRGHSTTRERNARGEGITVFRGRGARTLDRIQTVAHLTNPFLAMNARGERAVHGMATGTRSACWPWTGKRACWPLLCRPRTAVGATRARPSPRTGATWSCPTTWPAGRNGCGAAHRARRSARPRAARGPAGANPARNRKEQPLRQAALQPLLPPVRLFLPAPDKGWTGCSSLLRTGRLAPAAQLRLQCREGAGPRHLAFHPARCPRAYVVNELADSDGPGVQLRRRHGRMEGSVVLSTLPGPLCRQQPGGGDRGVARRAPRPRLQPGGDSIAVFDVDAATGRLFGAAPSRWAGARPGSSPARRWGTGCSCSTRTATVSLVSRWTTRPHRHPPASSHPPLAAARCAWCSQSVFKVSRRPPASGSAAQRPCPPSSASRAVKAPGRKAGRCWARPAACPDQPHQALQLAQVVTAGAP